MVICIVVVVEGVVTLNHDLFADPDDPVITFMTPDTPTTAGTTVTLTCTVTLTQDLVILPHIEWLTGDGTKIEHLENVDIQTSGLSSNLTFNPLHTSHGGWYSCRGSVNIPEAGLHVSGNRSRVITVQSKAS